MVKAGLLQLDNADVFSKMQVGEPYKRYKKTILGKVFIMYLDPFEKKPAGKLLFGNPRKDEDNCFFETWGPMDDMYFKRSNKKHFEKKLLVEVSPSVKVEEVKVKTVDEMTDEEMVELVNARGFMKLQQAMNRMVSIPTVSRLLEIADQQEKSEKIMMAIRKRLSELERLEAEGATEE